jgi:hypothetical protein
MAGADIIGIVVGAGMTIAVFSYLLGDNFVYRLVLHTFTGTLFGYTFAIVLFEVLIRRVIGQMADRPIIVFPVVIGLSLFLLKSIRRLAYVGNFPLAFLIGVGTAVALIGALMGTLVPQIGATGDALRFDSQNPVRLAKGLVVLVGTVCTLFAFDFTLSQKQRGLAASLASLVRLVGSIGRVFLTVALAVAFAGALTASLSFFIGRVQYLVEALVKILGR